MSIAAAARPDLAEVYEALLAEYGPQHWWPVHGPPASAALEVCVGAILVQRARWEDVETALAGLRAVSALDLSRLASMDEEALAELVRPAGAFRVKARRVQAFAQAVIDGAGSLAAFLDGPVDVVRSRCLAVAGVGPETADAIVLYAARRPTFLASAYAWRLFARLGVLDDCKVAGYEDRQRAFVERLPRSHREDAAILGEWHALIVAHGKARCRARAPRCMGCPLETGCEAAAGQAA